MSSPTLEDVFNAARGFLHDTNPPSGAVWTDSALQVHFAQPYRKVFSCLMGVSKRFQRVIYLNLPANTTVLIPATYNITDFSEPETIEERPAQVAISITSTTNATPINCLAPGHGLGTAGQMVEGVVSGVSGTPAPWGRWFATIVDANNFTLNGSSGDGNVGSGGTFSAWSQLPFQEVMPIDLSNQGMDGSPQTYLGVYLWINEQLTFPGATGIQQLRITYWASGTAPTITSQTINIDNSLDFLSVATAANAARANGWNDMADRLDAKAYGTGGDSCDGGLIGDFTRIQVSTMQRGPQRQRGPFRLRRSRFGNYVIS
jgi:hypothetical protein